MQSFTYPCCYLSFTVTWKVQTSKTRKLINLFFLNFKYLNHSHREIRSKETKYLLIVSNRQNGEVQGVN